MLVRYFRHQAISYARLCSTLQAQDYSPGTYVLRRVFEPVQLKSTIEGFLPKTHRDLDVIDTYKIYEKVRGPDTSYMPEFKLLLLDFVEDVGGPGDVASVKMSLVNKLLLSGSAVYASPDNLAKYASLQSSREGKSLHSSPHSYKTIKFLSRMLFSVKMSLDVSWTIEPWHVRACLRQAGVRLDECCIQLPDKAISGPDVGRLENKVFVAMVEVNHTEQVAVRCRIKHIASLDSGDATALQPDIHTSDQLVPVFAEDQALLDSLPPLSSIDDAHVQARSPVKRRS